jgi:hypothetical protein
MEDDKYLQTANEVLARMSPEGRVRFGRYLGQKAKQQGRTFIDLNQDGIDDRLQDPNFLAHVTMQMYQEQPGLLSQLFGSRRHHPRRRHGCQDGAYLSDPFRAEDLCESGEADGGFFDCDFGGDFFGGFDIS